MKKTICILPQKFGMGGPGSFQGRLSSVLIERGCVVNHDPLDPANNAILVIGGTKQINILRQAKQNGVRIVQRLNGMNWVHRKTFTGIKHFLRAEVNNWILATIREMADQIVYQSDFSQAWWKRVRGDAGCPSRVIYNGVSLDEFSPVGKGTPPADRLRILMVEGHFGNGYDLGFHSAMQMMQLLNQRLPKKTELMVVGAVPESLKKIYENSGVTILWKGIIKREAVPVIDRSAHLLFSSDINAACPNTIIEAMACGLPVIGYNTGSLPELITNNSGVVANFGGDPWKLEKPDVHSLADAAQQVLNDLESYRIDARKHAVESFDIQRVADQYLDVLLN